MGGSTSTGSFHMLELNRVFGMIIENKRVSYRFALGEIPQYMRGVFHTQYFAVVSRGLGLGGKSTEGQ
jgi:hypothetical protein